MTPFRPPLSRREVGAAVHGLGLTVVSRIDGGGQGDVFEASDSRHGTCALKVFVPDAKKRVQAEVAFLESVSSPAIVGLYASGEVTVRGAACPYTLMEYLSGLSLRERINNGRILSERDATILVKDMAGALREMWLRGKVHRDVKPDNILACTGDRYVLIDFGIVRHLDLPTMTALGFAPGTLGYKSPEHDSAIRNPTYKADVFSLGITVYEAMSGVHPFAGSQDAISQGMVPSDICSLCPCSSRFAQLLMAMLAPRAVMRPELEQLEQGGLQ